MDDIKLDEFVDETKVRAIMRRVKKRNDKIEYIKFLISCIGIIGLFLIVALLISFKLVLFIYLILTSLMPFSLFIFIKVRKEGVI